VWERLFIERKRNCDKIVETTWIGSNEFGTQINTEKDKHIFKAGEEES
jgi:hypothetical protein